MFITKALAAAALGLLATASSSYALTPVQPKFVPAPGTMSVNRYGPAAAPTQGRALIMGGATNQGLGQGAQTKLVDTFDGAKGFSLLTGQAGSVRYFPFAAPLAGGKVLFGAGFNENSSTLSSVEEYDPGTGALAPLAHGLATARYGAWAAPLADGRVIVGGGLDASSNYLRSAEIFDPATGTFTTGPQLMESTRYLAAAAPLPDGRVLIAGGRDLGNNVLQSVEIYNPQTGGFAEPPAQLVTPRMGATATALPDGKVLVAGGFGAAGKPLRSGEIFNPSGGQFQQLPETGTTQLAKPRASAAAALLGDGRVLIAGGTSDSTDALNTGELYVSAPEATAANVAFADQTTDTISAKRTVTVTNLGAQPLVVDGFAVGGPDPDDFSVGASTCDSTPVPFDGTCTFTVRFDPSATGKRVGTVRLSSNEPVPFTMILTGNGVAPKAAAMGGSTGTVVVTGSAPARAAGRVARFDRLTCRASHHRTRCTSRIAAGRVKLTSRSIRATLTRRGFVFGTGKALTTAARRVDLAPRRRLVRGRYVLTLKHGHGRRAVTIRRAVSVA